MYLHAKYLQIKAKLNTLERLTHSTAGFVTFYFICWFLNALDTGH